MRGFYGRIFILAAVIGFAAAGSLAVSGGRHALEAASTVVALSADFEFSVSESGPVPAGATLAYRYTVRNRSTVPQAQVLVIDRLPEGFRLVGFGANESCGRTNARGVSAFTCNVGNLAPGATGTATALVVPAEPGVFVTTPQARGPTVATVTTVVTPGATDLQLGASAPGATAGAPVVLAYQVRNNGTRTAVGARFTAALPAGLVLIGASASAGGCTAGLTPGAVQCALGDVAPGRQVLVTVTVQANTAGDYPTTAAVAMTNEDSKSANNLATLVVKVK